jgi:riboflavin biosynthesis pyrimidine reductase
MSGKVNRVFPLAGEDGLRVERTDMHDPASHTWLQERYSPDAREPGAPTPFLRVNMVSSLNGRSTGTDGTSNTLTSRLDRRILKVIRGAADVVLVGAETVRREGYRVPAASALAIVTRSGNLAGHHLDKRQATEVNPLGKIIVLCPAAVLPTVRNQVGSLDVEIIALGDIDSDDDGKHGLSPAAIIGALYDRGFLQIVCEGGPSLAGQLFAADLVDEFCLTQTPLISVTGHPLLTVPDAPHGQHPHDMQLSTRFSLRQLLLDDEGVSYARWSRCRDSAGNPASS